MKPRKTALFLSCLMLISTAAANVSAAERNEDHTNYEVSSEKFAARLKTIDGLKYSFDENGTPKGLYTGWARSGDKRNYYRNGKRCAGWQTIGGRKYYFYYEGGYAVGDVQVEDKIYTFNSNGVYTGKSRNAVVYAMNIKEPFYADELPDRIAVRLYSTYNYDAPYEYETSGGYQEEDVIYTSKKLFARIERYQDGKWTAVEWNHESVLENYGIDKSGDTDLSYTQLCSIRDLLRADPEKFNLAFVLVTDYKLETYITSESKIPRTKRLLKKLGFSDKFLKKYFIFKEGDVAEGLDDTGDEIADIDDTASGDTDTPLYMNYTYIDTKKEYKDMITPGKYRFVFHLTPKAYDDGSAADFEETEFYCYFTVK